MEVVGSRDWNTTEVAVDVTAVDIVVVAVVVESKKEGIGFHCNRPVEEGRPS